MIIFSDFYEEKIYILTTNKIVVLLAVFVVVIKSTKLAQRQKKDLQKFIEVLLNFFIAL